MSLKNPQSMATVTERLALTDEKTRQRASILTWAIILLVPVYAVTETRSTFGPIKETIFYWPWMVLIRLQPAESYQSDQYIITGIPWTLVLFLPSFYILNLAWNLYTSDEEKVIKSSFIILASVIQIALIGMTQQSQDIDFVSAGREDVSIYYIPQLAIIALHGYFATTWYYAETKDVLLQSKLKREAEQSKQSLSEEQIDTDKTKGTSEEESPHSEQ